MMPTPKGLPQKDDRVILWRHQIRGTVVKRGLGSYWSLTVLWDGFGETDDNRERLYVDASWMWDRGDLRLETK